MGSSIEATVVAAGAGAAAAGAEAVGGDQRSRGAPFNAGEGPKRPKVADVHPNIDRAIRYFDGEVLDRGGRGDRTT